MIRFVATLLPAARLFALQGVLLNDDVGTVTYEGAPTWRGLQVGVMTARVIPGFRKGVRYRALLDGGLTRDGVLFDTSAVIRVIIGINLHREERQKTYFRVNVFATPRFRLVIRAISANYGAFLVDVGDHSFVALIGRCFDACRADFNVNSGVNKEERTDVRDSQFTENVDTVTAVGWVEASLVDFTLANALCVGDIPLANEEFAIGPPPFNYQRIQTRQSTNGTKAVVTGRVCAREAAPAIFRLRLYK